MKNIGNSFKGILGGFVFIIIAVVLLWWNEGYSVRNLKTTAEMDKTVIDVGSEAIDPANEGKLIATHGPVINEQEQTDETFKVTVKTPILKRIVEMYQWKETEEDDNGNKTYKYEKVWSSDLIDSSNFNKSGHENPTSMAYYAEEYASSDVKVGAFQLSSNQIGSLSTNGKFANFDEEAVKTLNMSVSGGYITTSTNLESPQVGDIRVSFVYNDSTELSVLAVQSGNTFVDFVSKSGIEVNRVMDGSHSGAEMINVIKKENTILRWSLRFAGLLLCVLGFATILKPISTISGYVPILGTIVGSAVGFISFILGLALSLVVIAIAWVRFRPVLGIILLAIVIALIVLLVMRGKKAKTPETQNN